MGYDVHITRAKFWADNDRKQISKQEWLRVVEGDPDLELRPESGPCFAEWTSREAGPDGAWFDWSDGNVFTKWPTKAIFRKLLQIAKKLNAKVQGDDGEDYKSAREWKYDGT